ncbi:MAG: hypothetical protein IJN27_06780, partial [Oscillospiraceae bacterium]|nr:hypothetical protein [Oscillospiraceae bacterium]
ICHIYYKSYLKGQVNSFIFLFEQKHTVILKPQIKIAKKILCKPLQFTEYLVPLTGLEPVRL